MKKKKNYLDFVPVCAPGYSWKLNEKKLVVWPADANGAYLNSFLMTNLAANGLSGFAVEKAEYKTAKDAETGKEYKYLEVTVKSTK